MGTLPKWRVARPAGGTDAASRKCYGRSGLLSLFIVALFQMELVHQAVDDGAEQDGHHRQEGDAAVKAVEGRKSACPPWTVGDRTGPMPVRIIEAFNTASIQGRRAK